MVKIAFVLVAPLLTPMLAYASDCTTLIAHAEGSQGQAAAVAAKKAVAACKAENVKTARPYMVLAVQANQAGNFSEVIRWSEEGLAQEPGLPLAYMNICAAQMQMKKYDDAVQSCKQGLKNPNAWSAKLNFNIGLSLFKKAVDAQKFSETLTSEPYFIESQRLDPAILQNDFYLGMMEENVKGNPTAALAHYQPACKAGDSQSCQASARLKAAAPAHAVAQSAAQPAAPASPEEASLWDALEAAYRKKGLDAANAKTTVANVRSGLAQVPAQQRMQSLRAMINALK